MDYDKIAKFPTVIDNKHESIYKSYQILEKAIEMLERKDSNETILETIKFLKRNENKKEINIDGGSDYITIGGTKYDIV